MGRSSVIQGLGYCYDDVPYDRNDLGGSTHTVMFQARAAEQVSEAVRSFANIGLPKEFRFKAANMIGININPEEMDLLRGVFLNVQEDEEIRVRAMGLLPQGSILSNVINLVKGGGGRAKTRLALVQFLVTANLSSSSRESRHEIIKAMRSVLRDPQRELREQAVSFLMAVGDPVAIEFVQTNLATSRVSTDRVEAIRALAIDDPKKHIQAIRAFLTDGNEEVRAEAVRALGFDPSSRTTIATIAMNAQEPPQLRSVAIEQLGLHDPQFASYAPRIISSRTEDATVRTSAVKALTSVVVDEVRRDRSIRMQVRSGLPAPVHAPPNGLSENDRRNIANLMSQIVDAPSPNGVKTEAEQLFNWMQREDPALRQKVKSNGNP